MSKKPKVKYLNFKTASKKSKDFDGIGLFDPNVNTIYVDSKLPAINNGTKNLCLKHELAHFRNRCVDLKKILGNHIIEEKFIELEGIITCPNKSLSLGERILKSYILKKDKLTFNKNTKQIIKRMLEVLGFKSTNKKVIKILLEMEP